MPQLNKDQIIEIKKFIHSRGFNTIEVEMEILDHVASAVSAKLEKDPEKTLEKAIKEVHASFGVLGFSTIEDEKQRLISRLVRQAFKEKFMSYFKTNKALITLLCMAFFWLTIQVQIFPLEETLRFYPMALFIIFVLTFGFSTLKKFNKLSKRSIMMSTAMATIIILPNFGNIFGIIFKDLSEMGWGYSSLLYTAIMSISTIVLLAINDTIHWAYRWTFERYLKYDI